MINAGLIKKGFNVLTQEGFLVFNIKLFRYIYSKIISNLGSLLYRKNSKKYWSFRMKWDWQIVGGGFQTQLLAASMFANVKNLESRNIDSVLDYGCAAGDSSIIININIPNANIYLHDYSINGVEIGIRKYGRFVPVKKWDGKTKVDFVYCSNVIEHVNEPDALVHELVNFAKKYVLIQCPFNELDVNGAKITPLNPVGEHIWTIDHDFIEKIKKQYKNIEWELFYGLVPMAWEGGVQMYLLGNINHVQE